jgi:hypothetical protein
VNYFAVLHNPQQAHAAITALYQTLKPWLVAGTKFHLKVTQEKRSMPQNSKIHPVVREIAEGAKRPTDEESLRVLRYLLLEAWRNETGRKPMYERSLDGMRIVNVDSGTSDLDKPDCSEFIDWLEAWKAEHMEQAI